MIHNNPGIKRIGLAIELTDGQIIQVYSDEPGAAWVQIDKETDIHPGWHDEGFRTRVYGVRTTITINDLGSHLVSHYRPGTNFDEIEAPTRAITPPIYSPNGRLRPLEEP